MRHNLNKTKQGKLHISKHPVEYAKDVNIVICVYL